MLQPQSNHPPSAFSPTKSLSSFLKNARHFDEPCYSLCPFPSSLGKFPLIPQDQGQTSPSTLSPDSPKGGIIPPGFLTQLLIYTMSKILPWCLLSVYILRCYTDLMHPCLIVCLAHSRHSINDLERIWKPICRRSFLSAMGSNTSWLCMQQLLYHKEKIQSRLHLHGCFRRMG